MNSPSDRTPPSSLDAERGLIASLMLENGPDVFSECMANKIRPEYFYDPKHQAIFEAVFNLNGKGIPADEILVMDELKAMGRLGLIGGHAQLYEITGKVQTTVNAKHWMDIVRKNHFLRELIRTSQWTVEQAHGLGKSGDVGELLNSVETAFLKIQDDSVSESSCHAAQIADIAANDINKILARRGEVTGVPSGYTDLDKITSGFHKGDMVVIAARPSMGKTSLAMNIAEHATIPHLRETRPPSPTMVFSLEMSGPQLIQRMMCGLARVDMQKLRDGFCDRQKELIQACKDVKNAPLWVDASVSLNIYEIRAKARRINAKNPLGLVIIDYLQLISPASEKGNREQEVAEVSRGVKAMAKELNLPVIVLCQLNRDSERDKRPPRLSDLRESGAIEQDADVVLLIGKPREATEETPDQMCVRRELIIAKNRNGPCSNIDLTFNRRLTKFENYTGHAY